MSEFYDVVRRLCEAIRVRRIHETWPAMEGIVARVERDLPTPAPRAVTGEGKCPMCFNTGVVSRGDNDPFDCPACTEQERPANPPTPQVGEGPLNYDKILTNSSEALKIAGFDTAAVRLIQTLAHIRTLESQLAAARKDVDRLDRSETQLVQERDDAEEAASQMYYIVTGNSPEWSNQFGYEEAQDDVADAVTTLKAVAKDHNALQARLSVAEGALKRIVEGDSDGDEGWWYRDIARAALSPAPSQEKKHG